MLSAGSGRSVGSLASLMATRYRLTCGACKRTQALGDTMPKVNIPRITKPRTPMRVGHLDHVSRHQVIGWAAEERRPDAALTIIIEVDGIVAARIAAGDPRPDLVTQGRFPTPNHGFTHRFDEMLDPSQPHRITIRTAAGLELLPNGEHLIPAEAPAPSTSLAPTLTPILVTAPGRSGSTWLMSLLARSPDITLSEVVPYEQRLIAYYAQAYAILTGPGDLDRSTHPDRIASDRFHVGCNPFNIEPYASAFQNKASWRAYTDFVVPRALADTFHQIITEHYARLAINQHKPQARLFAEKTNHIHRQTRGFARRIFNPVREIILVRDPRDVLASYQEFFRADPDQAFTTITQSCNDLLASRDENRADVLILRYEDLMMQRAASLAALSQFIDVDISEPDEAAQTALFQAHATSTSPEASIGRWRTALPDALQGRCRESWRSFLGAFGY